MTREEHSNRILELSALHNYLLLRLPTSFGKSKIALDIIRKHSEGKLIYNVLIVIPRLVLIDNWKDEIKKWNTPENIKFDFTTYVSLHKHAEPAWDMIIFDETHHFTENCLEVMDSYKYERVICMSATIPKEQRWRLKEAFRGIQEYSVTARMAIEDEILPDPKVLFIPMILDNTKITQVYIRNKSKGGVPVKVYYFQKRSTLGVKNRPVHILCTEQEYYNEISSMIDWWKQKFMSSSEVYAKNNWLRLAKERLNWLAERKNQFVLSLLDTLGDRRVLTFCTSILQTEQLGKYCINSKNKESLNNLSKFNDGEINHITACGMLNEGMNLVNCQIGIYANIGSSEIVEIQRLGRTLRHKNPLLIIPYYVGTREEEIVKKMTRNYNEELMFSRFSNQVTRNLIDTILNDTTENSN
jgi:superfamily II DNA or RNA helicase